jgi:hypothetical protein
VVVALTGESVFFPFVSHGLSSWSTLDVTRECLKNLMSKGYMMTAEFPTSLVPMGSVSPAPVERFVGVCAAFFERGFGLLSHRFLWSLPRSYGLELHHLTPSGILHMAAFMTLCEAYIRIEPPLNMWSHIFWAQLLPDSGTRAASLGSVDILVRTGLGSDT